MQSHSRNLLVVTVLCASMAALSGCDRDLRLGAAAKQEPLKFSTDYQAAQTSKQAQTRGQVLT